jgi:hypothetical protein
MMFKPVIFVAIFCTFFGCVAQSNKTVDKSGKRPSWVNGSENNFIIISGVGNTVEDAKNECLKGIRDNIINSIAVNVRSRTEINIEQKNGKSDERMKFSVVSQAANIPFLNGISLSKSNDYYWEKVIDKKTKKTQFGYYVKYPFSNAELQNLIDEFQKQDEATTKRINYLLKAADTVSYLESYGNIIDQLKLIQSNMIDDRREKIEAGLADIVANMKSVNFIPVLNMPGEYTVKLRNKNKSLRTYQRPDFKSNCGKLTRVNFSDTSMQVIYDAGLCKYTDNPKGTLTFTLGQEKIMHYFMIDVNANKVELNIDGDILLKKASESGDKITGTDIEIPLFSKYEYPFLIKRIEMKYENQNPLVVDGLAVKNNAKGVQILKVNSKNSFSKSTLSSQNKSFPYFLVTVYYTNLNTGQENTASLSNIKFSSDW